MNAEPQRLRRMTLSQMKDADIGVVGTPKRDAYEFKLRLDVIGGAIKDLRKKRKLTQSALGELVGVKKAHISKLERSAKNVTVDTILKVFTALGTNVKLSVEVNDEQVAVLRNK